MIKLLVWKLDKDWKGLKLGLIREWKMGGIINKNLKKKDKSKW